MALQPSVKAEAQPAEASAAEPKKDRAGTKIVKSIGRAFRFGRHKNEPESEQPEK
jgi:hypothetical protein